MNCEPDCLLQSSFLEPKLQFVLSSLGGQKSGTELRVLGLVRGPSRKCPAVETVVWFFYFILSLIFVLGPFGAAFGSSTVERAHLVVATLQRLSISAFSFS